MEPTDDVEQADVVLLNTCCIRENADNKLYGHLGHLKSVKDRHPGMQIAVGGCLAQKDRDLIQERAPQVDAVFGTHNVRPGGRAAAGGGRGRPAGHGDPRRGPASRRRDRPCPCGGACRTPPGSPSRSAATTRAPSASSRRCGARRSAGRSTTIVAEVEALAAAGTVEVTLLGQNVNSYGRDLTRRRPLFAELLRAVGRRRRHPPGALHQPPPQGPAARDDRGHGRGADGVRAPPPAAPVGQRPGRWPPCTGATPAARYLEKLAAARAAVPDLAVTTDLIVGFPGETDDDFERTLEVVAEAEYDSAYTFLFSPRPGTEAGELPPTVRRPRRGRRALRAPAGGRRALGAGQAPGPRRPHRGGAGRGPEQARTRRSPPAAPGRTSSSTSRSPTARAAGGHLRRRRDHRRRPPPPHGRAGGGHRPSPPPHPHPGGLGPRSALAVA